ncbi:hypothetical protein O1611_g8757 [Lasiodiplodia mahajangana]|uniref:Uncharacterized protein n=1 Tax=Lasiodiplodia mahajangana TaxID=1108764 RepID=A0ACC2JC11_9PEZI|nr:hypothetical protein O1611_g8757 [Lasiodiplodia mahajangana]
MATITSQDRSSLNRQLYSPLDDTQPQIRLIEILPSVSDDQQICCRLETVRLSDDHRYAALSYVWGDPEITEDIMVNGIILPVTTNLASALRQFRKAGFPENEDTGKLQRLWADAICINQKDMAERSSQVILMRRLYGSASAVFSWLGPPGLCRQDKALQIIHQIAPLLGVLPEPDSYLSDEMEESDDEMDDSSHNELSREQTNTAFKWLIRTLGNITLMSDDTPDSRWDSLEALGTNNYWSRIWIVQEMCLARWPWVHWFICGDESITFLELDRYASFIRDVRNLPLPQGSNHTAKEELGTRSMLSNPFYSLAGFTHTGLLRRINHSPQDEREFSEQLDLLYSICCLAAKQCAATDPRDMIYGLLGLFPTHDIKPDYSLPVRDVFLEALSHGGDGRVNECLTYSGRGFKSNNNNIYSLPSWLPDLSEFSKRHNQFIMDTRKERGPLLGNIGVSHFDFLTDGTLHVQGAICGRVELATHIDLVDGNMHKFMYQLCVDYLVQFQKAPTYKSIILLLINSGGPSSGDTAPDPEEDDYDTREGDYDMEEVSFASGDVSYKQWPLQVLMDVLDWENKDTRSKISSYHGYSGLELSSVCWELLFRFAELDALTQDEKEDAIKRLGIGPTSFLDVYLKICLVGGKLACIKRAWADDSVRERQCEEVSIDLALNDILQGAGGKALFETEKGQLGIGPPDMKQGDLVCAVDKCTLPVLLRRVETVDGASFFEHVGTCYVLGLSDGEPGIMVENGELELQTFEIR